jgi:hypothetical protein
MVGDAFPYDVFLSFSAQDKAAPRASSLSASNGERCRSFHSSERLQVAVRQHLKVWPVPPKRLRVGGFDEWEIPVAPVYDRRVERRRSQSAATAELQLSAFSFQPFLGNRRTKRAASFRYASAR